MCGIAGVFNFHDAPITPGDRETGRRMARLLAHRGPDGEGVAVAGPVLLVHTRLAILDLSPAGRQPMENETGALQLVCNGEIYNYRELTGRLTALGHRFASRSDSEVILHAYEEWGIGALERLTGMFAFALWDGERRRLWLVRDRLGIKPLFYAHTPGALVFGSEIKAILAHPAVGREVDREGLSQYLALNHPVAPRTLLAGVRQLQPGHLLEVDGEGRVAERSWWELRYRVEEGRGPDSWAGELAGLLEGVVGEHLASDVPLGAFLSGGLDSSSVVHWMARHLKEPVCTFSARLAEAGYDETPYARQMAEAVGAEHHEVTVGAEPERLLPHLVWHAEEPTADSSMMGEYLLAREARRRVAVVLCGDGADEILAGYPTHAAYVVQRLYQGLPRWLRQGVIGPAVAALPLSDAKVGPGEKLRRFVASAELPPEQAHGRWREICTPGERAALLGPLRPGEEAEPADAAYAAWFARCNDTHPLNRRLFVDTRLYLPSDMLVKVDRMTMAHGLEARVPFLDHRVVELAARMPPAIKLRWWHQGKFVLKRAMAGRLPQTVLTRSKAGFNMPQRAWLRGRLRPLVEELLTPEWARTSGLLEPAALAGLVERHYAGARDASFPLWGLLILALWWRQFIATPTPEPPAPPGS